MRGGFSSGSSGIDRRFSEKRGSLKDSDFENDIKADFKDDNFTREQLAKRYNTTQLKDTWKDALRNNPKSLIWCEWCLISTQKK